MFRRKKDAEELSCGFEVFYKMGQEAHYEMMMQMKEKEDESCINNV